MIGSPRCGVSCHGFGTILTSSCWYRSQLTHGVGSRDFFAMVHFGSLAQGLLDVLRSGMAIIILWMGQGEEVAIGSMGPMTIGQLSAAAYAMHLG